MQSHRYFNPNSVYSPVFEEKRQEDEGWSFQGFNRAKSIITGVWNKHFYKIVTVAIVSSLIALAIYAVVKRRRSKQAEKEKNLTITKKWEAVNVYEEEVAQRHRPTVKVKTSLGQRVKHKVDSSITVLMVHPPHFVFQEGLVGKNVNKDELEPGVHRFTESLYLLFHLAARPKQVKVVALCFTPEGGDMDDYIMNSYRHKCKHQSEPNFASQIHLHHSPYSKWFGYNTARYELANNVLKLHVDEELNDEDEHSSVTHLVMGLDSSCSLIQDQWDEYVKRTWMESYRYLTRQLDRTDIQPVLTQPPPTQAQLLQVYELEKAKSIRVYMSEKQKRIDEVGGASLMGEDGGYGGVASLKTGHRATLQHVMADGLALLNGGGRRNKHLASKRQLAEIMDKIRSPEKRLSIILPGSYVKPHVDCIDQLCGWIPYAEINTPCFFDIPLMQKSEVESLPTPWFDSRFYVIPLSALQILLPDKCLGNVCPSSGPDFLYGLQLWSCGFVSFNPTLLLTCNLYTPPSIPSKHDSLAVNAKRADELWSRFQLNTTHNSAVLSSSTMALKAYALPANKSKLYASVLNLQDFVDLFGIDIWRRWPNTLLDLSTAWMGMTLKSHPLHHSSEFAYKYSSESNFSLVKSQLERYIESVSLLDSQDAKAQDDEDETHRLLSLDDEFASYIKSI